MRPTTIYLTLSIALIACSSSDETPNDGTGSGGSSTTGSTESGGASSSHSGGSSALGGGGAQGGEQGTASTPCSSPAENNGFVDCAEGYRHRVDKVACENVVSEDTTTPGSCDIEGECCESDADCDETAACWESGLDQDGEAYGICAPRCATDDDCGQNQICECGSGAGRCVDSNCETDADCGQDLYCIRSVVDEGCGQKVEYSCQTASDECKTDSDCATGEPDFEVCGFDGSMRTCLPQYQSCDS